MKPKMGRMGEEECQERWEGFRSEEGRGWGEEEGEGLRRRFGIHNYSCGFFFFAVPVGGAAGSRDMDALIKSFSAQIRSSQLARIPPPPHRSSRRSPLRAFSPRR